MKKHFLILLILSLVGISGWLTYKLALKSAKHLPSAYQQFFSSSHFKLKNTLVDITDSFYPKSYLHSIYKKDLKEFNLIMSQTDINNIKADLKKAIKVQYHDKLTANKQQITLIYNQNQFSAQTSFHGGEANNYIFNKTDYNIKLLDNQVIDHIKSFNLFNPSIHDWITPLLANQVAQELNLYYNLQYPVAIKINHKNSGVYLLEEKVNQEFLTRKNLNQAYIIKLKDETRLAHRGKNKGIALDSHHLSGFDFEIANVDLEAEASQPILFSLDQLFKTIKNRQLENLPTFFDLDYLARYDAYREFLGIDHDTAGDNLIMFYSPQNNKFYPIVRNEGDLNKLALKGGTSLLSFNSYNPNLTQQYNYPKLFLLLNRLPQFRLLKYQYLNQLVLNYPQLQDNFKALYKKYSNAFIYDTTDEASIGFKKKQFNNYLNTIEHNHNLIKKQLEFAQLAINVINQKNSTKIEIIPDSIMPIEFDQFQLVFSNNKTPIDITDLINQKIILADFSQDYNLIPTTFTFSINPPFPVSTIKVKAKNNITNQPVTAIYTGIATDSY